MAALTSQCDRSGIASPGLQEIEDNLGDKHDVDFENYVQFAAPLLLKPFNGAPLIERRPGTAPSPPPKSPLRSSSLTSVRSPEVFDKTHIDQHSVPTHSYSNELDSDSGKINPTRTQIHHKIGSIVEAPDNFQNSQNRRYGTIFPPNDDTLLGEIPEDADNYSISSSDSSGDNIDAIVLDFVGRMTHLKRASSVSSEISIPATTTDAVITVNGASRPLRGYEAGQYVTKLHYPEDAEVSHPRAPPKKIPWYRCILGRK